MSELSGPPEEDDSHGPTGDAIKDAAANRSTVKDARHVDRAALLGAALAAVVALSFSTEGEWDLLATAAGVALLAVLAAFVRVPPGRGTAITAELVATAAVTALAAALVVAVPLQALISKLTPAGRECLASAEVAAGIVLTDANQRRGAELAAERLTSDGTPTSPGEVLARAADNARGKLQGACVGAATSRWLWAPALAIGVAVFWVAWRRRARDG